MTVARIVGARLRMARGERQVADVADAVGVTKATLYRWETGRISVPPERWLTIAEVLGKHWSELFDPTPDPQP